LALYFSASGQEYATGASLALTTVKPHLVILTLPLLLLDTIWRKQWRVLVGFAGVLIGCGLILFVLYPAWPVSFWRLVVSGMASARETPTLTGLLVVAGERVWGKLIWAAGLLLAAIIWWKRAREWDRRTLIDVSILAGTVLSPIGWSYDQVMLLFPILRVLGWAADGSLARRETIAAALVFVAADATAFYERTLTPSEVWYFWVPLVVAAVYVWAWRRRRCKASSDVLIRAA
jgi:hypothetical protein